MSQLYSGTSEGFDTLVDGYIDYAKEVIRGRAIPDIRDGQKPVNRRILYTAYQNKKGYLRKCASLVGEALALHPHGDSSVYGAMVLMTDENGTNNVPFFKGMGNLGKVYSSKPPAQMRYPKAMLNDNANIFFKENDVMELIPAEEGEGYEPKVLNAIFPVVLVNGTSGIAVSTGTKMPSFNLGDVLDLTIKYIQNGKLELSDVIYPDFPTGGVLVCNETEIAKLMVTGRSKLKVRAKVEIEGKDILVKEVPIGKTAEGIKTAIENSDIAGIEDCYESMGRDSKALVTITCKNKRIVEQVLMSLYQRNILQNTFASNMLVVMDDEPQVVSVHKVIETWYPWRVSVLEKKFNKVIEGIQDEKITLSYFLRLLDNEEWKETFINIITKQGTQDAVNYLKTIFDDIPYDTCTWITGRAISAYHRGGSYRTRYESLLESEESYKHTLNHLDEYIIKELTELKSKMSDLCKRKTEISYKDYKFSKITDSDSVEDTSFCVYTLYKNGFLTKSREHSATPEDVLCEIDAQANSVLIGFDNYGRVIRVLGKEIPFTPYGEYGVYMPKYFEADFQEDYQVLYLCLLDGSKKTLIYRDGYIGFFDTNEFLGKKNIKAIANGVCLAVKDKLLHIYEENEVPDYLLLADDSDSKIKVGIVDMISVPERSRLSRAKVLTGTNINTEYVHGFNNLGLAKYMSNPDKYVGKLKIFKEDVYDDSVEIEKGKYSGICKDFEDKEVEE